MTEEFKKLYRLVREKLKDTPYAVYVNAGDDTAELAPEQADVYLGDSTFPDYLMIFRADVQDPIPGFFHGIRKYHGYLLCIEESCEDFSHYFISRAASNGQDIVHEPWTQPVSCSESWISLENVRKYVENGMLADLEEMGRVSRGIRELRESMKLSNLEWMQEPDL